MCIPISRIFVQLHSQFEWIGSNSNFERASDIDWFDNNEKTKSISETRRAFIRSGSNNKCVHF